MKVVLATEARAELDQIGSHIALDDPTRARSFVRELVEKAHAIGNLPRGFPLVPRYAHLGIRRRTHGRYLILYRVDQDQVTIVHIIHGARNYEALLSLDEET